jgi:sugar diacid utilization regulator
MIEHSGGAGRPKKKLNSVWIRDAMSTEHHLSLKDIAALLGIHRNTLRYKLRQMGLQRRFSRLSNDDLDRVLKLYKRLRPESGL